MRLRFTKMHGAGNDFVMLDGVRQQVPTSASVMRALADRHFGVGCDQILLVEPPDTGDVDFCYRIFNADGNEVEQCGNGARCFVRFVREQGLTEKKRIRVRTACGVIEPAELPDGTVQVDMGPPDFSEQSVAFDASGLSSRKQGDGVLWVLPIDSTDPSAANGRNDVVTREIGVASMGNPHAVQLVDDTESAPVASDGPLIEKHRRFARGVNAGFMQVQNRTRARLRVWERGVGETLACGTGACAAGALAIRLGLMDSPVRIEAPGGELTIAWQPGQPVLMSGQAQTVFEGELTV